MSQSNMKSASMLFKPIGQFTIWEFHVSNAIFVVIATLLFNLVRKVIPSLFGVNNITETTDATLGVIQSATLKGEYTGNLLNSDQK